MDCYFYEVVTRATISGQLCLSVLSSGELPLAEPKLHQRWTNMKWHPVMELNHPVRFQRAA